MVTLRAALVALSFGFIASTAALGQTSGTNPDISVIGQFLACPAGVDDCAYGEADGAVSERNADGAEMLARSMQARLACRSGVAGKLLKKRDEPGLWMEVYEHVAVPERFERLLEQAVEECRSRPLRRGPAPPRMFHRRRRPSPNLPAGFRLRRIKWTSSGLRPAGNCGGHRGS